MSRSTSGAAAAKPASAEDESLHFVRSGGDDLFVVLTSPTVPPRGEVVVLLQGGGQVPATHRNRMWVHLARRLAATGYHVVRFDYHGVGESSGTVDEFRLDRPFVADLRAVLDWLAEQTLDTVILVGNCFGARTAMAAAADVPDLIGVAAMTMPFRDYEAREGFRNVAVAPQNSWHRLTARALRLNSLRRLRYADQRRLARRMLVTKARASKRQVEFPRQRGSSGDTGGLARALADLSSRKVPFLLVYGDQDRHLDTYRRALDSDVRPLLTRVGVDLRILPGELIGYSALDQQEAVMSMLIDWVASLSSARQQPLS